MDCLIIGQTKLNHPTMTETGTKHLIGKRQIKYKKNGAPKVTEKVFKILVEADEMHE